MQYAKFTIKIAAGTYPYSRELEFLPNEIPQKIGGDGKYLLDEKEDRLRVNIF